MDETTAVQLRTIGYCLIGMAGGNVVHPLVMWWLDWSFWPALGVAAGAVALACVAVNAAWLGLRRLFARVMPARAERRRMDEARSRVIEQGKEVAVRSNVVRLRD